MIVNKMALRCPASASPMNSQFFLPMAVGRMAFSTGLLSISTRIPKLGSSFEV
jgi:hypothetical protein